MQVQCTLTQSWTQYYKVLNHNICFSIVSTRHNYTINTRVEYKTPKIREYEHLDFQSLLIDKLRQSLMQYIQHVVSP